MFGRIKIHRQIDQRGWRSKPNTFSLFLYLLTNANTEEREYLGQKIKIGDCLIGRKSLSKILGITEDKIRTSLEHLKSTNEITIKTTNKFSIITIVKYLDYQLLGQQEPPTKSPSHSPTNPQQIPTPIEYIISKQDILYLMGREYIDIWKGGLKILWLLIEKGYKLEKNKKKVEEFIDWIKNKSRTTFGLSQQGDFLWTRTYEMVEDCMDFHKNDKVMVPKQTHKSKLATWFGNEKRGFNNKK